VIFIARTQRSRIVSAKFNFYLFLHSRKEYFLVNLARIKRASTSSNTLTFFVNIENILMLSNYKEWILFYFIMLILIIINQN